MKVFYYGQPRSKDEVENHVRLARENRENFLKRVRDDERLAAEAKARHAAPPPGSKRKKPTSRFRLLDRVQSYLRAEGKHAVSGPAPASVVEQRVKLCMACPGRVDELDGLKDDGGVGFCTKCGCGANQRSKLSVKLTLAGVECPLGKFKKVEGTGGTIASAVEAARGVAGNLIAQARRAFG